MTNKVKVKIEKVEATTYDDASALISARIEAMANNLGLIAINHHEANPWELMERGAEVKIPVKNSPQVLIGLYETGKILGFEASYDLPRGGGFNLRESNLAFAFGQMDEEVQKANVALLQERVDHEAHVDVLGQELKRMCDSIELILDAIRAADELLGGLGDFLGKRVSFAFLRRIEDRLEVLLNE